MISLLARLFIKDRHHYSDGKTRSAYGVLCGIFGIFLNLCLFTLKFVAGTLANSIAITADAFNNLSDAGSSLITLVSFKFSSAAPDSDHPFGHGRYEYIAGFTVSIIIILMGIELGRSSVEKILHPQAPEFSVLTIVILLASIAVKIYMCLYNRGIGRKIHSPAMRATSVDSLSDSVATSVVLLSALFTHFTGINIDGWCGTLVAVFILYSGVNTAKEMLSPLIGEAASPELARDIAAAVTAHEEVLGIHDLIIHDYGPGRMMISLHAEVSGSGNIYVLHSAIDQIENELSGQFHCDCVIHMDPIDTDDERVQEVRQAVKELIRGYNPALSIHDFRMVPGPKQTNLIFDVVSPMDLGLKDSQLKEQISQCIRRVYPDYLCVIKVDRPFVHSKG